LGYSEFGNLDDVVSGGQDVVGFVKLESDVGESIDASAGLINNDTSDKGIDEGG
jgi:hypothetical protein